VSRRCRERVCIGHFWPLSVRQERRLSAALSCGLPCYDGKVAVGRRFRQWGGDFGAQLLL
jgi:hypothetical protein